MQVKLNTSSLSSIPRDLEAFRREIMTVTSDRKFLNSVGQLLVSRAKQNLEDGGADGQSYALLKPATQRQKRRKGFSLKPLQRAGQTKRSLSHEIGGGTLQLAGLDIIRHHQYGAPRAHLPQRKIYTAGEDELADIQDFLERRLNDKNPLK
jgi:phage gpG-like protein